MELAANPDILVATPGRLMHHLEEVTSMSLKTAEYVVFDEADRCASPPLQCLLHESALMHTFSGSRQLC